MKFHEEAKKLANDALDGMNVSKQTLANKLIVAADMIRRLEEAYESEKQKSSITSEPEFDGSGYGSSFQDIFGGVFK